MVEVINGSNTKPVSTGLLLDYFRSRSADLSGILYTGYPIVGTPNGALVLDAMFVSNQYGLVVFDLVEGDSIQSDHLQKRDEIYNNLNAKLLQYKELVDKRKLKVEVNVVTYAPGCRQANLDPDILLNNDGLRDLLSSTLVPVSETTFRHLVSVVQAVTKLRAGIKRPETVKSDSRGAKVRNLENSIANLDRHQSAAVIESAEGPQRIRGLAGSGKTIILALKAAYLHSTHPDWNIAVTFSSRSLKGQFKDLITKFTIEQKNEEPDWEKVKILHAWGSASSPGIYFEICVNNGISFMDVRTSKESASWGRDKFDLVCSKALEQKNEFRETYDAILIDEAQDFSDSFLKLCYAILRKPKRLIWAYDELQKLNEASMRSTKEVLGRELHNEPNKPKEDIILEKCYRNSAPVLVTAHALGFGIYRQEGLVQMFDDPSLWRDIGYQVESGDLGYGRKVRLKRTNDTSPIFLQEHSPAEDIIVFKTFKNNTEQIQSVAEEIIKNLRKEELQTRDIVVINADPFITPQALGPLSEILFKKKINSHIVGVTSSRDEFYQDNSVTLSGIHRVKGNEAPMVYVLNAEYVYIGSDIIKRRNILFTAMTRSKAWVRVYGVGPKMDMLIEEFEQVKTNNFTLDFTYPTLKAMEKINVLNREKTTDEHREIDRSNKNLIKLIQDLNEEKIRFENIDPDVREQLKKIFLGDEDI